MSGRYDEGVETALDPKRAWRRYAELVTALTAVLYAVWFVLCTRPGYGVGPWFATALALEVALYLGVLTPVVQDWLRSLDPDRRIHVLVLAAVIPYCAYTLPEGRFELVVLAEIAGLATVLLLFYRFWTRGEERDLWFLALFAAIVISKALRSLYPGGADRIPASSLGQLMWVRTAIAAILLIRGFEQRVPLWPARKQWRAGFLYGLAFVPIGVGGSLLLEFGAVRATADIARDLLTSPLTFLGILFGVALFEEFLVRGVLLQALERLLDPKVGFALTAILFGLAHLWFRDFPNWRFAILAALAGVVYGLAAKRHGLGAAMVAHALVVTVWRTLL